MYTFPNTHTHRAMCTDHPTPHSPVDYKHPPLSPEHGGSLLVHLLWRGGEAALTVCDPHHSQCPMDPPAGEEQAHPEVWVPPCCTHMVTPSGWWWGHTLFNWLSENKPFKMFLIRHKSNYAAHIVLFKWNTPFLCSVLAIFGVLLNSAHGCFK